jgi:hypothetical protein
VDLVLREPVVVLAHLVQREPVVVLLVLAHQVAYQVAPQEVVRVGVRIQLVAGATPQAHLESQVADHLRVASQSAPSVKSSTT